MRALLALTLLVVLPGCAVVNFKRDPQYSVLSIGERYAVFRKGSLGYTGRRAVDSAGNTLSEKELREFLVAKGSLDAATELGLSPKTFLERYAIPLAAAVAVAWSGMRVQDAITDDTMQTEVAAVYVPLAGLCLGVWITNFLPIQRQAHAVRVYNEGLRRRLGLGQDLI